ncbi:MAG: PQQ-binding-like beta-propeller repeat protein [Verrucomicrobia bacterium]|nr:PQQ-binding-like beta-propeller repeat protein [Verrucomicrobiota bacterium]
MASGQPGSHGQRRYFGHSYQFIGGPRTARFTPFVSERVALWGPIARDAFSGVLLRAGGHGERTDSWREGDFSDGKRIYRLHRLGEDGVVPAQDLLTGAEVEGGLALGADFQRNGGHQYSASRWNQIGSCGERIYWTNGRRTVRVADAETRGLIWEKEFEHPAEQVVSDGNRVVVMLTENLDYRIDGIYDNVKFNPAVAVVALDAASGRELWRNTDVAGMPSNFLGIGHGAVVASTYLVEAGKRERAMRPVSRQGAGYDQYAANRMVSIDAATGRSHFVRTDFSDIEDYNGRQAIAIQENLAILVGEYHVNLFDLRGGSTVRTIRVPSPGSSSGGGYEGQYHAVSPRFYFKGNAAVALDGETPPDMRGNTLSSQRYDTRSTPANGMLYANPMLGTVGAHSSLTVGGALILREPPTPLPDDQRLLQEGTASIAAPQAADWPTFRGNIERNAWTTETAAAEPRLLWETRLAVGTGPRSARALQQGWRFNPNVSGPLTQPVADGRRVLVAAPDAHRLDCLNLEDGSLQWSVHFGGRISGPPTLAGSTAFVGAGDGTVSAIHLECGRIIWQFLASPNGEMILAHEQVEALHPVPPPTLFNGLLFVTAGRHSALEDGIRLWALDPATGAIRKQSVFGPASAPRVNDILQVYADKLQLFNTVIDPDTLALSGAPHIRGGNTEAEAPHAFPVGGGIRGGSTWIRPLDQWMGYNADGNPGVVIRPDGLRVDVHGYHDKYMTVLKDGAERVVNIPNHPFDVVHSVVGAWERLYLAGRKDNQIRLLVIEVADGTHRIIDVPAISPGELGIIPDSYRVIHHRQFRFGQVHEQVIPDGIAISHGTILVTTTAGRILAFR